MRTINHSSTVINPRGPVVACCFVWNLLVRTMRPSFSGEASLGLAQGNREEGLLSKEARLAVLFEEHVRREACMAQSRLTPSRTPTQPSSLVAEAAIPYQGRDSRRSTLGQNTHYSCTKGAWCNGQPPNAPAIKKKTKPFLFPSNT